MIHALRGRPRYPGKIDEKALSFSPISFASLKWWLRGSSLDAQETGSDVTQWLDESGEGHDVGQAVVENIPVLVKDSLNGHTGVVFVNDLLSTLASMDLGQAITMFMVFNNTSAHFEGLWDTGPGSGNVFRNLLLTGVGSIDWWDQEPAVALGLSAGPNLICINLSTVGGTTRNINYWRNGTSVGLTTFAKGDGLVWSDFPGIGAYNVNGGYFVGTIYESLWFDEVLGSTNRAAVENYLRGKYNI